MKKCINSSKQQQRQQRQQKKNGKRFLKMKINSNGIRGKLTKLQRNSIKRTQSMHIDCTWCITWKWHVGGIYTIRTFTHQFQKSFQFNSIQFQFNSNSIPIQFQFNSNSIRAATAAPLCQFNYFQSNYFQSNSIIFNSIILNPIQLFSIQLNYFKFNSIIFNSIQLFSI